mgnify:CR=1 FL=1
MQSFKQIIEGVGLVIDGAGVLLIVVGLLVAAGRFVFGARREADPYRRLRQDMGRGILLGLELLVAADIIRTVAVDPTLENVTVLGLIVLIRTFLSMALPVIVLCGRLGHAIRSRDQTGQHRNDPMKQPFQLIVLPIVEPFGRSKYLLNRNTFQGRTTSDVQKTTPILQAAFPVSFGNVQRD